MSIYKTTFCRAGAQPFWGWRVAARHKSNTKLDKQCAYNIFDTELPSCHNCYSLKAIIITYSECVFVALVIQHAMRMHRITLSSVACPALNYFSPLSHKCHDFRKVIEHKICALFSSTTFVWNISHSKKNWARYEKKMSVGLYVN